MPDVEIGPNSIVGAGSIVTGDVPPNTVYAGNPARFICTYEEYLEKCLLKDTGKIPRENMRDALTKMFEQELEQRVEVRD
jgi:serine acetyltransferase